MTSPRAARSRYIFLSTASGKTLGSPCMQSNSRSPPIASSHERSYQRHHVFGDGGSAYRRTCSWPTRALSGSASVVRQQMITVLRQFVTRCRDAGIADAETAEARYALVAFIDDRVLHRTGPAARNGKANLCSCSFSGVHRRRELLCSHGCDGSTRWSIRAPSKPTIYVLLSVSAGHAQGAHGARIS